jgi:capsular polysaccharide biosynthesis protein
MIEATNKTFTLPRYFIVVLFLLTVVSAFLTMDMFRSYATETLVLVVPRDARSASLANQIVETSVTLPSTLAFYDRLIHDHADITDPWQALTPLERRAAWNERILSERLAGSGVIRVTVLGQSINQSRALATRVQSTLEASVTDLYGKDFSIILQTIDQPLSEARVIRPWAWAIVTLSIGFVSTVILFGLIAGIQRGANRTRPSRHTSDMTPTLTPRPATWEPSQIETRLPTLPVEPVAAAAPTKKIYHDLKLPNQARTEAVPISVLQAEQRIVPSALQSSDVIAPATPIITPTKASGTPSNLPFVDGEFSWEDQLPGLVKESSVAPPVVQEVEETTPEEVVAPETPAPIVTPEPTEEELKRRLNQLLRGEL